ncbi:uncharacterized protein LY89DRAFT_753858 [Mollisia scopiformis]|uniref:Uncharacterized protein n=1 Tax=Mollisia scopiformis TaxID=149040 RepID=A0A194X065_MOLSC|nr:uncharacterized protein LY89DRAFT_753858 [Mollisia scopiformis]KUJ13262.1 hypothetical protein LY89DRAFT_753858 [Mollisia scopiformis]
MAKYDRVSSEDSSNEHLLPDDSSSLYSPVALRRSKGFGFSISTACLLVYCALSTTAMVIFMVAILNQLQPQSHDNNCQVNKVFKAAYGHNTALMSVDHKYDALWEVQDGQSQVLLLPDEDSGGELVPGAFSMFHQLHCLSSLRHAIQMAREGKDPGLDQKDNTHWPHCMDYLRKASIEFNNMQTILCWADSTIERETLLSNGSGSQTIDGTHDVRQCGDSRALIKTMRDQGKNVTTEPFPP